MLLLPGVVGDSWSLWGGLAGLLSVSGLWGGGICQEGACSTWGDVGQRQGSMGRLPGTCPTALKSSGSHTLGTHSPLRGSVSVGLRGTRKGQRRRVLRGVAWGSAHL